ncbi:hypothetical protein C7M61_003550 [Candidozyma pseudohaemuli]|uniref:Uncharacterized protein n=1 Tax=Candidozyma pseudohaemuli TaxID=418784 RepID=A0A2P7YMD1_9ASCO|nr:hypothetical protein C7M61_003550 [[Candida] pseudohaemulonii]PSK37123.1 hypothetical protein C7M61_003550 [[Candida] pseudohaemulonii]
MDISDEETPQVKRPVFKKKKAKGGRAVKRVYEEETENVQKRVNVVEQKSNSRTMERIQRYRSLKKDENEEDSMKDESSPLVPTPSGDAGLAYTVLPDPAKTFSLKESHFREKPVEIKTEYEKEYDDISDDQKPQVLSDSDHEMDVPNVEYTTAPLADPDQYFTEIVDDVEMEEAPRGEFPGLVSAYLAEIGRITKDAQEQVDSARTKAEASRLRIEAMEAKKQEVLRGAESGRGVFGTVADFIRSLYRNSETKEVVERKDEKDDIDVMLLWA